MEIAAPHIANLFSYAHSRGISERALRTLLSEKELDVCNPEKSISKAEFLAVLREVMNSTADPWFGLHYGSFLNIKALGFILQISLTTSAIEQAVLLLQQYLRKTFPIVCLSVKEVEELYILTLSSEIKDDDLKRHVLDSTYAFIYRELKLMLPPEAFPSSQLPYENRKEYERVLNGLFSKGNSYSFAFPSQIGKAALNRQRTKEISFLLPCFLKMLDMRQPRHSPFSMQIRAMILNMCAPELPTFEQVSAQFPLSKRSIQRKLTEEGTSFRNITNEIRKELSDYLTKGKKLKTKEVAAILGYAESSAYLHAVKKWEARSYSQRK